MVTERARGFTLIELMVTVAVAAVLLAIGVPTVSTVIQNQRLSNTLESMSRGLYLARSESSKSGDTVTICARASDTQCGTDWNNGYLVFRDSSYTSTESQASRDAGDEIIRVTPPFSNNVNLAAIAAQNGVGSSVTTANHLHYRANGRSGWGSGTFYVCDGRGNVYAKGLHITASGEIRASRHVQGDTDTALRDIFGEEVTCP